MEEDYGLWKGIENIRREGMASGLRYDWRMTKINERKGLERTLGGIILLTLPISLPIASYLMAAVFDEESRMAMNNFR